MYDASLPRSPTSHCQATRCFRMLVVAMALIASARISGGFLAWAASGDDDIQDAQQLLDLGYNVLWEQHAGKLRVAGIVSSEASSTDVPLAFLPNLRSASLFVAGNEIAWPNRLPQSLTSLELVSCQEQLSERPLRETQHGPVTLRSDKITHLVVSGSISSVGETRLSSLLPGLQQVALLNMDVSNSTLQDLGNLPLLEELALRTARPLSPADWGAVSRCGQLHHLTISGLSEESDIAALTNLPELRSLHLDSTTISGAVLGRFVDLDELFLSDCTITANGLRSIAELRNLRSLTFERCTLSDINELPNALSLLAEMSELNRLGLVCGELANVDLLPLKKMQSLKSLWIMGRSNGWLDVELPESLADLCVKYTPLDVRALSGLPRLRRLRIQRSPIRGVSVELAQLDELELSGTKVRPALIESCVRLPSLTHLSLENIELEAEPGKLRHFLSELHQVTHLRLAGCGVGLSDIAEMEIASTIDTLAVPGSAVADDELAVLTKFPRLRSLDLSSSSVSDRGMRQIAANSGLVSLTLAGSRGVGDQGLRELGRMRSLKHLDVCDTCASASGIARLSLEDVRSGGRVKQRDLLHLKWKGW